MRLKTQYRVLIDGLVHAENITIAAKGEGMTVEANSINLLFIVILQIGGAFATVAAVKTDITWIKHVIKKHGEDLTKLQDKL